MAKTTNTNPCMELWNKYAEPPPGALKAFDNGNFKGTDISPMWRIKCLTEEFGPCGIGWYTEIVEHWIDEAWTTDVEKCITTHVRIRLYLLDKISGEWTKPIEAVGGNTMTQYSRKYKTTRASDEAYKMAYTDAIGGACKLLGIGGKIYWERGYSKYENDYVDEPAPRQTAKRAPAKAPAPMPEEASPAFQSAPMPEASAPDPVSEEETFRRRALMRFSKASLDKSCMANFGTSFDDTPYETLREVPVLRKIGGLA